MKLSFSSYIGQASLQLLSAYHVITLHSHIIEVITCIQISKHAILHHAILHHAVCVKIDMLISPSVQLRNALGYSHPCNYFVHVSHLLQPALGVSTQHQQVVAMTGQTQINLEAPRTLLILQYISTPFTGASATALPSSLQPAIVVV